MARATIAHQWGRAIACVLLIPVLLARSSTAGMLAVYYSRFIGLAAGRISC